MVVLALGYCIGVIAASFFPAPPVLLLVTAVVLPFLAVIAVCSGRLEANRKHVWGLLVLMAAFIGGMRMQSQLDAWALLQNQVVEEAQRGDVLITGALAEANHYGSRAQLVLTNVSVEKWGRSQRFPSDLIVRTGLLAHEASIGDQIQFTGRITPIRRPRVEAGFDFQQYRHSQNIFAESYVSPEAVRVTSRPSVSVRSAAYWAQDQVKTRLFSDTTNDEQRSLITGLLSSIALGIRSGAPPSLTTMLHASGLAHITSISGLHVSLVLFGFAYVLKCVGLRRRWAGALTVIVAVLYLCLVGFRVPTVRAALMAFVLIGGYFTERRVDSLNSLGLAALLVLLYNPAELWLPSFQLSFTAVLALILFHPVQQCLFQRFPAGLKQTGEGMFASAIVITALAPFSLYTFHNVTPAAIVGNLIAVPILGVLLPLTYIWLVASLLPFAILTDAIGWALMVVSNALLWTIQTSAADGAFQFTVAFPGVACLAAGFLALLLLGRPLLHWAMIGQMRVLNLHIALLLFIVAGLLYGVRLAPNQLRVDFVALGQGDCILVRTPNDRSILIDGGPKPSASSTRQYTQLEEFLLAQGVNHLDAIVLTHPQSDHIGALPQVVRRFSVTTVFEGATGGEITSYRELIDAIEERGVQRQSVSQGDSFKIDGVIFWALSPADRQTESDVNEQSLVLWMRWKKFDAVFTGDIGAKTEQRLAAQFDNWDADVLKVAHHGSRYSTSEEFLRETMPEVAVIQTGRNAYGHPHIDTRQRLYDINAHVLRTDYDGSIHLKTNGDEYRLYASRSNRLYLVRD